VTSDATALRLLIVADDPLARTGLATLLSDQPDCTISGQVPGGADLSAALDVYRPDVVVWDLGWDPALSLERLPEITDDGTPVVALLPDETHVTDAWISGVRGLLLREVTAARLVGAVRAVAEGLIVIDPMLADVLRPPRDLPPSPLIEQLTPRELEVLQLLVRGLYNKSIGFHLDISEHTVKFHVNAIMSKLSAQSRTEAAVRATQMGLVLL
jgi:two-component system nitrate/nitrite response regulator NarL